MEKVSVNPKFSIKAFQTDMKNVETNVHIFTICRTLKCQRFHEWVARKKATTEKT